MKVCPYCHFDNPPEALSCLSCKNLFERQCPFCQSWSVIHNQTGFKCLNCQKIFQVEDVPNKTREEFENKLSGGLEKINQARQEGKRVSVGGALSPFKDLFSGAVKQAVDDVKVQNDPQWIVKANVHSLKLGLASKILYTVLALLALFCGAVGYLIGREGLAFIFFIAALIVGLVFIRPKLAGYLGKTFSLE